MFAKWVLVPAALAVSGFFLLGPRMGKILPSFSRHSAVTATPVADTDGKPSYAAPDVEVQTARSLQPPDVEISAQQKIHHRHRQHPVVVDENAREPVDAYAPPSQGSKPHRTIGTGDGI